DIAVTPQTACVGDNGILAATVDETSIGGGAGVNSDYDFDWFQGNSAGGTPVTTTTPTNGEVNQLPGNLMYTVRVTSNATGCRNTSSVLLPENITHPAPSIVAVDQTECAPANGELIAT